MRLLFVHDHRFLHDDGTVYSAGAFPAVVWTRYLRRFDDLLVLGRDGGRLPQDATPPISSHPNVDFQFLPSLGSLTQLLRPSADARAMMREAVERCDAVVARLPSELGLLAMKTARQLGKPYAVEVVGCAWDGYVNHGSPAARLYAPLLFHRMRSAVRKAPMALYVTSSWLQGRYPSAGITTFVSDVEIEPLDEAGLQRRRLRLDTLAQGRAPRLGTIASLGIRSKGIQTAIPAIAKLRAEGLDLSYAVLGAGDPAPWQALAKEAGVSDLVSFDGTREAGAGVRQWLDEIDLYLQPSFQEGLPRATIEAMSRGAACIGSTCGGIPELLSPDRTHRPGDVAGLASCIRRLARDPAELARASRDDLATTEHYRPEILLARRDKFYGTLRQLAEAKGA